LKIAIVILNWNGKGHLENYLPSVVKYGSTENSEIIIADNGSTDDSCSFLQNNYPAIRIIRMDKNYGFAGGYNKALEGVEADLLCLLNSDVEVTNGWLDPVVKLFSSDDKIAAIQPKILSDRNRLMFEHAGAAGGFIDKYGFPFCRGRIMNAIEFENGQYNQTTDIFWASGACLFIRADVFRSSGGFDADYFAHMEEIDLCWRLKNKGYRIIYSPDSKVYHYGGATLDYNNPRKLFLNFRNSLWTLYKNYTGEHLRLMMMRRMLIDTFAIIKFFVTKTVTRRSSKNVASRNVGAEYCLAVFRTFKKVIYRFQKLREYHH
jgi:GT2 family glycosyltransferase